MYRVQKNITITKEQEEYVRANFGKMNIPELSKMLGITYNRIHKNLGVMGMVKQHKAKVVTMKGYFDEENFFKQYRY